MGWDIVTIGQHHLDIESLGLLAKQLSEGLDINIDYGYYRKHVYSEDDNTIRLNPIVEWVSLGLLIRHSEMIIYYLEDTCYCEKLILSNCKARGAPPVIADNVWFDSECKRPHFVLEPHEDDEGDIYFLDIYEDFFEVSLNNDPGRWYGFYHLFDSPEYSREVLHDYRIRLKLVANALRCEYIYLFADQGPTDCISIDDSKNWSEIEYYLLSLRWIDDNYDIEVKRGYPDKRDYDKSVFSLIDVPVFLTAENPVLARYYSDVFRDDFSDLN